MNKVLKNDLPARRVSDLGMELQTVDFALDVADDGVGRILRLTQRTKTFGQFSDVVPVTVPHIELGGKTTEKVGATVHPELPRAVFTLRRTLHRSSKIAGDKLQSVADTQNRKSQVIDAPVQLWRIGRINAGRSPGKNDAIRCDIAKRGSIRPERKNLGIHAAFAYAPGDHLRVLRAEIEDDNLVLR
jgi:hypothetical protein